MVNQKYYSQYEEDKILNSLLKQKDGFCIEIGGYDGITRSNSYFFEKIGWRCLIVEPIPRFYEAIKKVRQCDALNVAVSSQNGFVDFYVAKNVEELSSISPDIDRVVIKHESDFEKIQVRTMTLDSIIESYPKSKIDFITIDVEGHEMDVLLGFNLIKYLPRIIIIEDNSNGKDFEIQNYLAGFGFIKFKRTGCNDWYTSDKSLYNFLDLLRLKLVFSVYFVFHHMPSPLLNFYRYLKSLLKN